MEEIVLALLKTGLGEQHPSPLRENFLRQAVSSARKFILREGITLTEDPLADDFVEHCQLVEMYAEYLVRKRNTNEPMPRMLRYALNELLVSQKGGAADAV